MVCPTHQIILTGVTASTLASLDFFHIQSCLLCLAADSCAGFGAHLFILHTSDYDQNYWTRKEFSNFLASLPESQGARRICMLRCDESMPRGILANVVFGDSNLSPLRHRSNVHSGDMGVAYTQDMGNTFVSEGIRKGGRACKSRRRSI